MEAITSDAGLLQQKTNVAIQQLGISEAPLSVPSYYNKSTNVNEKSNGTNTIVSPSFAQVSPPLPTPPLKELLQIQTTAATAITRTTTDMSTSDINQIEPKYFKDLRTVDADISKACSVLSSLYEFTAPELLKDDNSFGCYHCTKLHMQQRGEDIVALVLAQGDKRDIEEIAKALGHPNEDPLNFRKKSHSDIMFDENNDDKENVSEEHTNSEFFDNLHDEVAKGIEQRYDETKSSEKENSCDDVGKSSLSFELIPKNDAKIDTVSQNRCSNTEILKLRQSKQQNLLTNSNVKLLLRTATKQYLIKKAPKILTLHLKRFMQLDDGLQKINTHVSFPEILDLSPFATAENKNLPLKYTLYGVVEHIGGLTGGHYIAYVRNKGSLHSDDSVEQNWFYFSDTTFRKATFDEVQNSQAYLLFYERNES